MSTAGNVMGWLTSWLLLFMLLFVLAKTRGGHTIIYYGAWLVAILLIVTHGKQIASIFQQGGVTP